MKLSWLLTTLCGGLVQPLTMALNFTVELVTFCVYISVETYNVCLPCR